MNVRATSSQAVASRASTQAETVEFLVVGAGVAGSCIADGLRRLGHEVVLVDRASGRPNRFRGEYLQPSAVQRLVRMGFGEALLDASFPLRRLHFRDLRSPRRGVGGETWIEYPDSTEARAIQHVDLIEGLRAIAEDTLGSDMMMGTRVEAASQGFDPDVPEVVLRSADGSTRRLRPRWILGCDGRGSLVRRWMGGAECPPTGRVAWLGKRELLAGALLEGASGLPEHVEVVRTRRNGTLWTFPLGSGLQRVYWNLPAAGGPRRAEITAGLHAVLDEARPHLGCEGGRMRDVTAAPSNPAWLGPAARGRLVLAGDALAVTSPLGGQGISCASAHVERLLQSVSDRRGAPEPFDTQSLRGYEAEARARYREVRTLNFHIYHLFYSRGPVKGLTRLVVDSWRRNPERLVRLGDLFGGTRAQPLRLREVPALMGLPTPHSRRALTERLQA
ncbi:MAG: FAD-dependent monooxygenase [Deltaproteobacteria bacterium]|nr:FAD-dependent monooxygenase [Deltaproteobacteria bacterium]